METVAARVGDTQILVEASVVPVPEGFGSRSEFGTRKTGVKEDLRDAYAQLKDLLRDLSDDLGSDLAVPKPHRPSEVVLEFGLSFSTTGNVWVLKASGEMTCTVSMKWSRPPNSE